MPRVDLTGRAIAITGASSGIGRATALACAEAGMDVALGARRVDRLESAAALVRERGRRAVVIPTDVAQAEQCRAFVAGAAHELGRLDAVFANAGIGFEGAALDRPIDEQRRMFEVNFWGSFEIVCAAAPYLERSDAGHALLCSSCLSKLGVPFYAAYCATKAAQDHYARALRLELRRKGVAVSSVHPIGTDTEFFDQSRARSDGATATDRGSRSRLQPPERVAGVVVRQLRRGTGREIWTSLGMRLAMAAAVAAPGIADRVLVRMAKRRGKPV